MAYYYPMEEFQETVWEYYKANKRDMPWRQTKDPYKILVSEVMLQQTQVDRVIPKYELFVKTFPNAGVLARASFSDVLSVWSGLGYNRRAKFLHESAERITNDWLGSIPEDVEKLQDLPGVGYNTAAAIAVYAFKQPVVFIETNIRTVFIHHFFNDQTDVDDKEILPLVEESIDTKRPDEWYWALMDYGTYIKKLMSNPSRKSKHYSKQSKFEGSRRQVRGKILKALLSGEKSKERLVQEISDERTESVINELIKEGLVIKGNKTIKLKD